MIKDKNTRDDVFGNMEEKRVILGSETSTAIKMGRIPAGAVTRKSHSGSYQKVEKLDAKITDVKGAEAIGHRPFKPPKKVELPQIDINNYKFNPLIK